MPATYRDTETGQDRIVLSDLEKKRLIDKRRQKYVDELLSASRNRLVTDLARGFLLGQADALAWVMRVLENHLTPEDMEE